jgi:hypothetical protein
MLGKVIWEMWGCLARRDVVFITAMLLHQL